MISYLQAENLTRRIGDTLLFGNICININKDDKIALVAVNGAGKSTLLDIISGKETPDTGSLTFRKDLRISYLRQSPELNEENTILEELFNTGERMTQVVLEYEKSIISGDSGNMGALIQEMDDLKAWDYEVAVRQILSRLDLNEPGKKISMLSGGERKRVALAKALACESDLLLLDEPTNHLDLDMIEWLEDYLIKTPKSVLMVTHDRYFLERVCTVILELSNNEIFRYEGNYEYYLEKKQNREAFERAGIGKARNLLRTELEWMRKMPKARRHKSKSRIESFYDLKEKAAPLPEEKSIKIGVGVSRIGKKILEIRNLSKSYGDRAIIQNFSYSFNRYEKAGLVGSNGSGKTTFLDILTGTALPDSGTVEKGETVIFGYYRQQGIVFDEEMTVTDFVKKIAEEVIVGEGRVLSSSQFMNYFLFPPAKQQTLIRKLSGGERRRLYLLTVLMKNPNFLILDEPTNDLDILTLNILEDYLTTFKGCVLVVSHDRYFLDKIAGHIFEFRGNGVIKDFTGNYTQLRDSKESEEKETPAIKTEKSLRKPSEKSVQVKPGLTFKEKRELESVTAEIEALEREKAIIESEMNAGISNIEQLIEKSQRHGEIVKLLEAREMRWLELSEKQI